MKKPVQPTRERKVNLPEKTAIVRAVASSTAIETGRRIEQLEHSLRAGNSKFQHLTLAR